MSELLCDLFYFPNNIYTDEMFNEMWNYNKNEFVLILFYLRNHRYKNITVNSVSSENGQKTFTKNISGTYLQSNMNVEYIGRGERKIFYQALKWMSVFKLQELRIILPYIPDCGYWKDLLVLMGTPAENYVVELFGMQLIKDYMSYSQSIPGPISLSAKWTPNEKSSSDKIHGTNGKIAKFIGVSRKTLRTKYLVPLRRYLQVTEQLVSEKRWNSINYNIVPQYCLKLHSKSFRKNDQLRFNQYIRNLPVSNDKHITIPNALKSLNKISISERSHQDKNNFFITGNISNHIITPSNSSAKFETPLVNLSQHDLADNFLPICIYSNKSVKYKPDRSFEIPLNNDTYVGSVVFAIDISGAMTGFPIKLSACLCCESNSHYWIPFDLDSMDDNLMGNILYTEMGLLNDLSIKSQLSGKEKEYSEKEKAEFFSHATRVSSDNIRCYEHKIEEEICATHINRDPIKSREMCGEIQIGDDKIDSIIKYRGNGYNINRCIDIAKRLRNKHIIFMSNLLIDISEFPDEKDIHITYWTITKTHPIIVDYPNITIIEGYDINIYHELCHGNIITRNSYKNIIINKLIAENTIPIFST